MRLVQKPGQAHQWDSISAISLSHFTVWLSVIMVLRDAKHLSHSIVLFGYCKHIYGLFLVFLNNINKRQVCSITCCIKGRSPGRKFEKILKMLSLNYFPITICTLKLPGFSNFWRNKIEMKMSYELRISYLRSICYLFLVLFIVKNFEQLSRSQSFS